MFSQKKKGFFFFAMLSQGSLSSACCISLEGLIQLPLELMNPTSRKRRHGVVQHKVFIGAGWE